MAGQVSSSATPTLPPERPGFPAPPDLARRREDMGAALAARRPEPRSRELDLAGVRALRFDPPGPPRGVVLHLHGGGFRLGAPESVAGYAAALADRCGAAVVCPAYRLAPEHPFPAGLADARAAMRALQDGAEGPFVLSGDSAGGGLAAGLATLAAADARPPAGLVLHSPWLDLTVTSPSYEANAGNDPLFSKASAQQAADFYLQGHSPRDPLASPLFAVVEGFPPTFISAGEGEVLVEDARRFHDALRAARADARLLVVAGMQHVAVTRSLALAGAAQTFAAVAAFLDRILGPGG